MRFFMVQDKVIFKERVPPPADADGAKENKLLRYDRDLVEKFGLKAARFVTYLECWLHGKVTRTPSITQYTYDPAWLICQRTGLKPATLERVVKSLLKAKFIKVKYGKKHMRHYALVDQNNFYDEREEEKRRYALKVDADQHGDPVAILLYNLRHWKEFDRERKRLFQGRYWRHDTVKNLVHQFAGFLSKEQLRDALRYMYDNHLIKMIGFYDANGVPQDGRFWITLMEIPPIDDYEPKNMVRPALLFTPDGQRIEAGIVGENAHENDDKTASPNDKTPLANDKTEAGQNILQLTQAAEVTGNGLSPLNSNRLLVPSEVAAAPSSGTQVRVSENLPLSDESARPSASRKPPASSAKCLTADDDVFPTYRSGELADLKSDIKKLTRQVQQLTLNSELKKIPGMDREGWLENLTELLLRIPKSDRRNFLHKFAIDRDNAVKPKETGTSMVNHLQLQDELRQVNMKKIPRECFGQQYGDPRLPCKRSCLWAESCKIATPVERREAIQFVAVLSTPDFNASRETDRPENVAETYRTCHREVFGIEAPDTVGKAAAVYRNAQSLRVPVRLFCLIYMCQWADTHPRQKFYAQYLSGETAFELVGMVLDLCKQKYGSILEDRLTMVLHLKFTTDKKQLWRHQPTPAERFMTGWLKACAEVGIEDYQFRRQEVNELMGFTSEYRLCDAEDLIDDATEWLSESTGQKTLMAFLCKIQDKPEPEPEIEAPIEYVAPWYEHLIRDEDDDFGFKHTRAYYEAEEREKEIKRRSRPDSGSVYVEQTLTQLQNVDAPKRGKKTH